MKNRPESIDQFRGFATLMMALVNHATDVQAVPAWFKHAHDVGLTFGISARKRRERDGLRKTIEHFGRRYLAILGLGAILSAGETLPGMNKTRMDWGALQAIALAVILSLIALEWQKRKFVFSM